MTLEEVKKIFRYGWIAKDSDLIWNWFSEEPELNCDDDSCEYYWFGGVRIEIGFIEHTENINSLDSLIEIKGE